MALKSKLTKDEHAKLPDALKEHYVERDGAFVLDADGLEDAGSLRSALEKERKERAAAQRQHRELLDKIGDMDPEQARAAVKKLHELEEKGLLDAGKVEEVIKARTDAMQKDHANQIAGFKKQVEERDAQISTLTKSFTDLTIKSDLTPLFLKKGGRPEALEDAIARMTMLGVDGVRWAMKDGAIVALAGDQIKYGKDPQKPMSFDEGLELLASKAPHLFQPSSGAGAGGGSGAGGAGGFTISREDARNPQKYQAAKDAAAKAGQSLNIAAA